MIKKIISISAICFFLQSNSIAQIKITGDITNPGELHLNNIPSKKIGKIFIRNHIGVKKKPLEGAKGFLFIDGLDQFTLIDSLPKNYSRYIYTVKASDGYAVTFSWNELHNTPIGKRVFLLTETESHPNNGIILISKSDRYTGRRFVKDVSEIQIERK